MSIRYNKLRQSKDHIERELCSFTSVAIVMTVMVRHPTTQKIYMSLGCKPIACVLSVHPHGRSLNIEASQVGCYMRM